MFVSEIEMVLYFLAFSSSAWEETHSVLWQTLMSTYEYRFYKRQDIQISTMYNAWQHLTIPCHQFSASYFPACSAPAEPRLSSGQSRISFKYISTSSLPVCQPSSTYIRRDATVVAHCSFQKDESVSPFVLWFTCTNFL